MTKSLALIFLTSTFAASTVLAQSISSELSSADEETLKQVQALINNPAALDAYMKKNPEALKSNASVKALTGNNKKIEREVYEVSADVLAPVVKKANGDPAALAQILKKASENPEAFFNSLPAHERAKIKAIANQLQNPKKP